MAVERLQRYDLIQRIAAGGMGEVFRARVSGEHGFQKTVAVKRILPGFARDPEFVVRFVAEAKLAVALGHANIVQVFDLGRAGDELFLVMEYVDGVDLGLLMSTLERRAVQPPIGVALHVAIEAAKGLAYAHDRIDLDGKPSGVVHCDVSPSNLMVSFAGEVKLTDFGVAQALDLARRTRASGQVVGKLGYLAPEQLAGEPLDPRTDLYSLGVVLHEVLASRRLFQHHSAKEMMEAVMAGHIPRLAALRPDVPPALDDLVARATAREIGRRPSSARRMLAELTEIQRGLAASAITAPDVGAWARELAAPGPVGGAPSVKPRRTVTVSPEPLSPSRDAARQEGSLTFIARTLVDGPTIWQAVSSDATATARHRSQRRVLVTVAGVALLLVAAVSTVAATRPGKKTAVPAAPVAAPVVAALPARPEPVRDPDPPHVTVVGAATVAEPPPTVKKAHAPAAHGFVNIYAEPWATVFVDGKKVGTTPLARLPLPAGTHRVRLTNPSARAADRVVRIVPNETQLVDVDLVQ